jgi:hypothetical protein
MATYYSNKLPSQLSIVFSWIIIALDIASIAIYSYLLTITGKSAPNDNVIKLEETLIAITLIFTVAFVVSFLAWFYRAYANLQTRIDYPLERTPGWAIGAWFVPIVNLFRPYQMMSEMYEETETLLEKNGQTEKISFSKRSLDWWWVLLLASAVASIVLRTISRNPSQSTDFLTALLAVMLALNLLDIMLRVMWMKITIDYSRIEPLLKGVPEANPLEDSKTGK